MKKKYITYWVALLLLVFAIRAMAFTNFLTTHVMRGYVAPQVQSLQPNTDLILQQAENLSPQVLNLALTAYRSASAKGLDEKGLLTIIDYSKPSTEKRLWVIDLHDSRVLFHTLVAHGKDSGMLYAKYFTNYPGTHASCLGVLLTGHTYYGSHGYSLRLLGLEKGINDHAYKREIVMHQAWYVSDAHLKQCGCLGRSWGCPALSRQVFKPVIQTIKDGTLIFVYYPDTHWLRTSQFLHS